VYYTGKLISLSIFLVVKWGQSSPWRSGDSTCALAAVIYGWECAEIKLQLLQKPLDVLGTFTLRPRQRPSWFSRLSAARRRVTAIVTSPTDRRHQAGC